MLFLSGLFIFIASLITFFFFSKASLVKPAPFPTTFSTSQPVITERTALLVVVLPIPISPTPSMLYPFSFASFTTSIPTTIAFKHSSYVIAGPFAILSVDFLIFLSFTN